LSQTCISQATFFIGKRSTGGLVFSDLRKLRQLEEENHQLKKLVADLSLDNRFSRMFLKKSFEASPFERVGQNSYGGLQDIDSGATCSLIMLHTSLYYYVPNKVRDESVIRTRNAKLPNSGFVMDFGGYTLLRREGLKTTISAVHRIYCRRFKPSLQ